MNDDDAALVARCRRGEAAGYRALYTRYAGRVFAFARRFLGDDQHAEDVTQEVFLRVFRKLDSFRGEARFSTWLFRVTVNSCKNKRRSLERAQRLDHERVWAERLEGEGEAPPERALEERSLGERIDRALEELTEEQRTLLLLKAVDELSYREIGQMLGQSENQVRGKLYRARKLLRERLEDAERVLQGVGGVSMVG